MSSSSSSSSPSPSSSLPTPRQLLTSLLQAISEIPPPLLPDSKFTIASTDAFLSGRADTPASNPLKHLDPSHRPLFTTLHVLFPSLLLPALDLLDRRLVTRLLLARHEVADNVDMADGGETQQAVTATTSTTTTTPTTPASSAVYVVRSAQKIPGRRPFAREGETAMATMAATSATAMATGQISYLVHMAPWNCSCAAFAFAAFPPGASALAARADDDEAEAEAEDEAEVEGEGDEAGFGGLSFDGVRGGGDGAVPPCCKHLLACVLAERWAVLAEYVNERRVAREELAGIVADM